MCALSHYHPLAAYRLQLTTEFKVEEATKLISYFKDLGIDTLYMGPYFEIPKHASNPYLITSPLHFNTQLGGEKAFKKFFRALKKEGLFHILDLVSNHLAALVHNPWFYDVLEKGEKSPYASYFDILFDPYYKPLKGKILLPLLPMPLEQALQNNYIRIVGSRESLSLRVGPIVLPMSEKSKQSIGDKTDLHSILDQQYYLLTFWKSCYDMINYRRFFDIVELIGIRMEEPSVYQDFHQKVFELIHQGYVDGLRIDHPDGLFDPEKYLRSLSHDNPGLFVIVEKILQKGEHLPSNWNIAGSVGYEYLNLINGLFIDQEHEKLWSAIYENFTGVVHRPSEMLYTIKKTLLNQYLQGEIDNITYLILQELPTTSIHFDTLKTTLIEFLCHLPIYRTYIQKNDTTLSKHDEYYLRQAYEALTTSYQPIDFDALKTLRLMFCLDPNPTQKLRAPLMRLQQLMPCIMAKSLEDTFLYRYNRMLALNDVGSSALNFGTSSDEFHRENLYRLKHYPMSFLTTSTHDTKRSEDVRYRLAALSEFPHQFNELIQEWHQLNQPYNRGLDKNIEYFIYQTLIGFWPSHTIKNTKDHKTRLKAYLQKAAREAKDYTNWVSPNTGYEDNIAYFLDCILDAHLSSVFLNSLAHFLEQIIPIGRLNSLTSIALKMASPGTFDLYQGLELFNETLVDPDNRRKVDFKKRRALLKKLKNQKTIKKLYSSPISDLHKLHSIYASLQMRKTYPKLFLEGAYIPLTIEGKMKPHLIALMWQYEDHYLIVIGFTKPSKIDLNLLHRQFIKLPVSVPVLYHILSQKPLYTHSINHACYISLETLENPLYPLILTNQKPNSI